MSVKETESVKRTGKNLAEFRALHDKDFIVPKKIREGLKNLAGSWDYESVFSKNIGVSLSDLGNYREQFAAYVVHIRKDGKRAWSGNVATAKAMREMVS